METENTEKIREHIRNQSPQFLKLMNIYLIGHRNRACPKSLYLIIIVLIILIIIIILILIF